MVSFRETENFAIIINNNKYPHQNKFSVTRFSEILVKLISCFSLCTEFYKFGPRFN